MQTLMDALLAEELILNFEEVPVWRTKRELMKSPVSVLISQSSELRELYFYIRVVMGKKLKRFSFLIRRFEWAHLFVTSR